MSNGHWRQVARCQGGVISYAQLSAAGLSRNQIDTLYVRGDLHRRSKGVFMAAAAPATYEAQLWWACLATGGVLGFATATHQWEMTADPGERVDVVVSPARGQRSLPGVRIWRRPLPPKAITRHNGLPITSRTCSALDHLGTLPLAAAVRFADRALQQRWLTRTEIERRLDTASGRTGNRRLRQVLRITADGAAAESERILHRLLRERGLVDWLPNYAVRGGGRLIAVLDVAFPGFKIGVEVDGLAYHSGPRFQPDRTRQNRVQNLGWRMLRFTWADLVERPDEVIDTILAAIATRSSA